MEMTSTVMCFALATYFMKRGGSSRLSQTYDESSWSSPYEFNDAASEDEEDVDSKFVDVVSTHVANLRLLLVEQRFQDWSKGITELRDYVAANGLLGSLVTVLVKMITKKEDDAVCIVQVIEHMCFENDGKPSEVFDQMAELLFQALSNCCESKENAGVAIWMLRAVDAVVHGLRQYHEQQYGTTTWNQRKLNLEEGIAPTRTNSE